jgi:hypothetical protein
MTDYIAEMINSIFIGIGVAVGTTISELWIKPKIHEIRDKLKKEEIKKALSAIDEEKRSP